MHLAVSPLHCREFANSIAPGGRDIAPLISATGERSKKVKHLVFLKLMIICSVLDTLRSVHK